MKNNMKSNEIMTMGKNIIKRIQLQDDEYIELPYPLNLDEFDLDGPYLRDRVLVYEIQHMNNELNDLRKKVEELLK